MTASDLSDTVIIHSWVKPLNLPSRVSMVEASGVEPLSESSNTQASPSAVLIFTFPLSDA